MKNSFRNYQQKTTPSTQERIEKPKYLPPNNRHPFLRKILTFYNLAFPLLHALFTLLLMLSILLMAIQITRGLFFLKLAPLAIFAHFPKSSLFLFTALLLFSLNGISKKTANWLAIKLQ